MTTADTTATATAPTETEAASLAAHNTRKSSRDLVYDAILDLSDSETPANVRDIAAVTGLGIAIVYDSVKTLKQRGRIYSDNGAFFVTGELPETQAVSQTVLPNGFIKLEKADQVMDLNPREARALARSLAGYVEQAAVILMQHRIDEQQAQIRRLHREHAQMRERMHAIAPERQGAIAA